MLLTTLLDISGSLLCIWNDFSCM